MKCSYCGEEYDGRSGSKTCSTKCRTAQSRYKSKLSVTAKCDTTVTKPKCDKGVTDKDFGDTKLGKTHLNHKEYLQFYYNHPDKYVQRREPEKLNWGPWLNPANLRSLGFKANRVSIPGDWDYEGVCEKVEGKWEVCA